MLRRYNQTAQNGIIVNIIEFLLHHLVAADLLRMHTLLPNLMRAVSLMLGAIISELIEQPFALLQFDLLQ